MKVLLVEPYFTGSHRAWAEGYANRSTHEVRLLTHPGRWWKWRMRGSALTLALTLETSDPWRPDVVLASDMMDLAQFRTFARPYLGDTPVAIYFHETQLSYPDSPMTEPDFSYALTNWLSAMAADAVFFNSGYHRDAFFEALPRLLRHFPDFTHAHLIEGVPSKSQVLPVGIDLNWAAARSERIGLPRLLWNHRWDHDKDPDTFAGAVDALVQKGIDFELVLTGARPPRVPRSLERIRRVAGDRIIHDGESDLDTYRKLVASCDVVVSTALQEFFGISIVEAIAAGCRPVLPNRLAYPWLIPNELRDEVLYRDGGLIEALAAALDHPEPPVGLRQSMFRFSWDSLIDKYDTCLSAISKQ
ncbi:MAG TPA: DUF3524 domain-containing protein [Acidimicrobiia bacterium]|nr:DUF3524 domain-containing protein [Acidimicrobiia bacterium]